MDCAKFLLKCLPPELAKMVGDLGMKEITEEMEFQAVLKVLTGT